MHPRHIDREEAGAPAAGHQGPAALDPHRVGEVAQADEVRRIARI